MSEHRSMSGNAINMLARAKINLFLHVAGPDAKRYHPLRSLVAFADVGDEVSLVPATGGGGTLTIDGPFAEGLSTGEDNLIIKAMRRFEAASGISVSCHDLHLTKALPVASGLGGGSADAGAVLRLLREAYASDMADAVLEAMAAAIGADGVMCLWMQSALAEGYGEHLTRIALPELHGVLINPGVACSTAEVYGGLDAAGVFTNLEHDADIQPDWLDMRDTGQVIAALHEMRNDLEPPAMAIQPVIGEVLASLRSQPQTRLARMSGSGATCFALCDTDAEALSLADQMRHLWTTAWVRACTLS